MTGTWSMTDGDGDSGYDSLNRLIAASATSGPYAGLLAAWNYDSFGNRTFENFGGNLISQSAPPIPASTWDQYNANNQVQSSSSGSAPTYDASGNVTQDDDNQYLYDAEGRVCASFSRMGGAMTGYLYDADGNRVAKGPISTFSCDTSSNGFGTTGSDTLYILGPSGEQLTEMTWSGGVAQFAATNVSAAGQLIASYSPNGSQVALNFQLRDWLGTLRAETDYAGNVQEKCESLPYGNGETCVATAPYLFTQHERDAESGNDYFKYRYYASSMGRWLSPDPSGLRSANLSDPQSLNLYDYVGNKPLTLTDLEGLCWKGFSWACMDWNRFKRAAVSAKNEFRYGEWTSNTDQAKIHSVDQYEAQHRNEDHQKETSQNGIFENSAYSFSTFSPLSVMFIPVDGVPIPIASFGFSLTITYIPKHNTWCLGGALGSQTGLGRPLSATFYPSYDAAHTRDVISSFGWTLNGQPTPLAGFSDSQNSSGALAGYTLATDPGASAAYGYTQCEDF